MTLMDGEMKTGRNGNGAEGQARRAWDAEPWPEAVNGEELLDELTRTVGRFVVVGEGTAEAGNATRLRSARLRAPVPPAIPGVAV